MGFIEHHIVVVHVKHLSKTSFLHEVEIRIWDNFFTIVLFFSTNVLPVSMVYLKPPPYVHEVVRVRSAYILFCSLWTKNMGFIEHVMLLYISSIYWKQPLLPPQGRDKNVKITEYVVIKLFLYIVKSKTILYKMTCLIIYLY